MRKAGILLHISSLPGKYGIGSLGKCAYDFIDFLRKTGQYIWQIMPIGPTSYGDSPYQGISAFAFNPYFIDLDLLVEDKLLLEDELPESLESNRVDYGNLFETRYKILDKAYERRNLVIHKYYKFVKEESYWLEDYALYMVLKQMHEHKSWFSWEVDYRFRNPLAMEKLKKEHAEEIRKWKFYQFLFYDQWMKLKSYAEANHIEIVGDLPIYSAYDSSDVWANPKLYQLDNNLKCTAIAGCPPDQFSSEGQVWGNPLYDWAKMKEDGYSWWVKRLKHSQKLFHSVRLDHFRGFAGYYSIPFWAISASYGHWEKGPGIDLFQRIKEECPKLNIIAENLGVLTPDVCDLLRTTGYPGMNIFQFEFGNWWDNVPIKGKYPENNVFYSGTHDNQTIASFYESFDEWHKLYINSIVGIVWGDKPAEKIVEFCLRTRCDTCIIPLQDYMGLFDFEGRMNVPSKSSGNWQYKTKTSDFSEALAHYILRVTKESGR